MIQIVEGYQLNKETPIDDRIVASGSVARDNIIYKYEGLRVFDTHDGKSYVWYGATWSLENSGSGTFSGTASYAYLSGTASYANTTGTASYANTTGTASYANTTGTASWSLQSLNSNIAYNAYMATTASYAYTSTTASYAYLSGTSSYAYMATTASYSNTSGTSTTASYAYTSGTASYASTFSNIRYETFGSQSTSNFKFVIGSGDLAGGSFTSQRFTALAGKTLGIDAFGLATFNISVADQLYIGSVSGIGEVNIRSVGSSNGQISFIIFYL